MVAVVDDSYRLDELFGHALFVGALDCSHRVSSLFAIAQHHGVERTLDTFPALIAVHGVVSAGDGSDTAYADGTRLFLDLPQISGAALGRSVAPVRKCMHKRLRHTLLPGHAQQR